MSKNKGLLGKLFNRDSSRTASNASLKDETSETKKCLRCLRRVSINYEKCPHCRSDDFQY